MGREWDVCGFLCRLRSLQRLCGVSEGLPGGLLFVGGQDGRHNKGSLAMFKYLFFGAVGKDLTEPSLELDCDFVEDMVLLVQKTSISIMWRCIPFSP